MHVGDVNQRVCGRNRRKDNNAPGPGGNTRLFGGLVIVIDLWSCASTTFIKTRRELEWKPCEENPRSISATRNSVHLQYSYCITGRRTFHVSRSDPGGNIHRNGEGVVEQNSRWHTTQHRARNIHIRRVKIFCTELSVLGKIMSFLTCCKGNETNEWNFVVLTIPSLGFEPAMKILLRKYHGKLVEMQIQWYCPTYPLGVKVTAEWYSRAMSEEGMS